MTRRRWQTSFLIAGLAVALFASAAAIGANQRVSLVRIATPVGGAERVIAYGSSRLLLVPQETRGVRRIWLNGSLDRSFGKDGSVPVASEDAVVAPDGKILIATTSCPRCEVGPRSEARVTRLLPNGRPDPSFGGDGSVDVPFGRHYNYGEAVALAPDGDILLGGIRVNSFSEGFSDVSAVVARLRPDGSRDRSFGEGGVSVLPGSGEMGVIDIASTPSGGVVVDAGDRFGSFLWKLCRDGSTDRDFGRAGVAEPITTRPETIFGPLYAPEIAVLPGGKLLLAGSGFRYRGDRVVATRLLPDGSPDRSYGENGWAALSAVRLWAKGLTVLPGGAIIVATAFAEARGRRDFGLIGFGPNGHLERRFGKDGRCRAGLGSKGYDAVDVAVVGGRVVVAGSGDADSRLLSCPLPRRR